MCIYKCIHSQHVGSWHNKIMQKLQSSVATFLTHLPLRKWESSPILLTQREFEGLGEKLAAVNFLHEDDTQTPQYKKLREGMHLFNSSLQFILKMPASQLQQFWVIAWSCHLPCEVCDMLQQRSLFSFKSQLEKRISIPLSLISKRLVSIHLGIRYSIYLIKHVNDIKVN